MLRSAPRAEVRDAGVREPSSAEVRGAEVRDASWRVAVINAIIPCSCRHHYY